MGCLGLGIDNTTATHSNTADGKLYFISTTQHTNYLGTQSSKYIYKHLV